nr:hypothetical protein Itr_chr11CG23050 [Ipomoea trifida]
MRTECTTAIDPRMYSCQEPLFRTSAVTATRLELPLTFSAFKELKMEYDEEGICKSVPRSEFSPGSSTPP